MSLLSFPSRPPERTVTVTLTERELRALTNAGAVMAHVALESPALDGDVLKAAVVSARACLDREANDV